MKFCGNVSMFLVTCVCDRRSQFPFWCHCGRRGPCPGVVSSPKWRVEGVAEGALEIKKLPGVTGAGLVDSP